tara:strand:- start:100 stop:669 length:570 start_codon:yes stop_codon:yes gene_type:complete
MQKKQKTRRTFRNKFRNRKIKQNTKRSHRQHNKRTRRKRGGMEPDPDTLALLNENFPKGTLYMSQQFSCGESPTKLKQNPRNPTISLNPNGSVKITWLPNSLGSTRTKIITGVQDGVTVLPGEHTGISQQYYVGMTLNVKNEKSRPWFSSHSSSDGCQLVCKLVNENQKLATTSKFQTYIKNLKTLIPK